MENQPNYWINKRKEILKKWKKRKIAIFAPRELEGFLVNNDEKLEDIYKIMCETGDCFEAAAMDYFDREEAKDETGKYDADAEHHYMMFHYYRSRCECLRREKSERLREWICMRENIFRPIVWSIWALVLTFFILISTSFLFAWIATWGIFDSLAIF